MQYDHRKRSIENNVYSRVYTPVWCWITQQTLIEWKISASQWISEL